MQLPNANGKQRHKSLLSWVNATGEPTRSLLPNANSKPGHISLARVVGADSELTRDAGDSEGDATLPSSCTRQSLSGDISFLFFLALVTHREMTGRPQVGGVMGAVDTGAVCSAAEAVTASAAAATVASVAARLRTRHLLLRSALLALYAFR